MNVVLVGEDGVGSELSLYLQFRWPEVSVVSTGDAEKCLEMVEFLPADLLFIDLALPRLNFIDLLTRIRTASDVPIILLCKSGNGTDMDRARGLEAGADDCVTKPFDPIDLLARTRAVLRRVHGGEFGPDGRPFIAGDMMINFNTREVFVSGKRARLTPTEYKLLTLLVRNQGRYIPHRVVLERVWGARYDDPSYIRKYVHRLRQKLKDDSGNPRMLLSERGVGYKFMRPITALLLACISAGPLLRGLDTVVDVL